MKKLVFLVFLIFFSCSMTKSPDYPIHPVPFTSVKVNDSFWAKRIQVNRDVTIPSSFKKCEETGRVENFDIAAGKMEGEFRTNLPFDDSDVYKIIEGASYSLAAAPDSQLDAYLDLLIEKIADAQEEDGYIMTWRTINPNKPPTDWSGTAERWSDVGGGHELYNVGHMYEAAVAHYEATAKRTFLDVAIKNADYIASVFGPGKLMLPPGHEEVEIGLIKLYRATGNIKYLNLAKFFIDQRGNAQGHKLYGEYSQDHIPLVEQKEAVGHAVRAGYFYSGVADVAALTGNQDYINAIDKIWENVVSKKLYITGGIGARRHGEAFGDNYELPNATSYNETCAAIANVMWNFRMFLLKGSSKYLDVLERTLYNGLLSGISLSGDKFFYPNCLAFDGKTPFNQGETQRKAWFNCSCCPSNVSRFIPSVPGYIYATRGDTLFINLYIGNQAHIRLKETDISVSQKTEYPWEGHVEISVSVEKAKKFVICSRIPGWAQNQPVPGDLYQYIDPPESKIILRINEELINAPIFNGFFAIDKMWQPGDKIQIEFPMPVQKVVAHQAVKEDIDKIALERGPIVYCAEEVDNGNLSKVRLDPDTQFSAIFEKDVLNGVTVLRGKSPVNEEQEIVVIPYYAWSHRELGEMEVWLAKAAK